MIAHSRRDGVSQRRHLSIARLGLRTTELASEHTRQLKQLVPDYYPLSLRFVAGSALLALGTILVAMDLVRWYPMWANWSGEPARYGGENGRQVPDPAAVKQQKELEEIR